MTHRHSLPRLFAACLVSVFSACAAGDAAETPAPAGLCAASDFAGELAVGHATFSVSYRVPWQAKDRALTVHVWYPASVDGEAGYGHPRYLGLFPDEISLEDAPLAKPANGCRSPVYAYSHGYQGYAGNSIGTAEELVREGWVVVAPDHANNTLTSNQPDLGFDLIRALDMQAVLDAVTAPTAGSPVAGRASTERVMLGGHSYGGQTAWIMSGPALRVEDVDEECTDAGEPCPAALREAYRTWSGDARIAALVALDGNLGASLVKAGDLAARRTKPILMLTAKNGDEQQWVFENGGAGVTWAWFQGSCHETFTSLPDVCDGWPKEEGLALVRRYLKAMGDTHVRGTPSDEDAALLSGAYVPSKRLDVRANP